MRQAFTRLIVPGVLGYPFSQQFSDIRFLKSFPQ
jgi:hypothetical protein